jgi:dihydroorotate dehydrogenase electron transfer subunit
MQFDKPLILPIKKITTETPRVKSFEFEFPFQSNPGQFLMMWIPGYDEVPVGIVKNSENTFLVAVAAVGEATKVLHEMKEGDKVGFRGPYGTFFTKPKKGQKIALVAGGYGMSPLSYLAQEARKNEVETHLFLGARNKDELLFAEWMKKIGVIMHVSTDDGSEGFKGFAPDLFKQDIEGIKPDYVYMVGPEIMEMKIAATCKEKNIPFDISLERYIKCGIGLCGQCCVDPTGWRMCTEGPVLTSVQLEQVTEFGHHSRFGTGKVKIFNFK